MCRNWPPHSINSQGRIYRQSQRDENKDKKGGKIIEHKIHQLIISPFYLKSSNKIRGKTHFLCFEFCI